MLALAFLALRLVTASVPLCGVEILFEILDLFALATDSCWHIHVIVAEETDLAVLLKESSADILSSPSSIEEQASGLRADQESRVAEVEFLPLVQADHTDPIFALDLVSGLPCLRVARAV